MKNKIITSEGNVQFQFPDGKIVNVHPNHLYTVFNEDTVSFILIALPPSSGLAIMASKAEDLELDGQTYSIADLPNAVSEAFAEAGAQARCEIVDELPTTGKTNTIYLLPKDEGEGYDEYIYIKDESKWELIGDTSIEIKNYLKKSDFNEYSAATKTAIDSKQGTLIAGEHISISGNVISAEAGNVPYDGYFYIKKYEGNPWELDKIDTPFYIVENRPNSCIEYKVDGSDMPQFGCFRMDYTEHTVNYDQAEMADYISVVWDNKCKAFKVDTLNSGVTVTHADSFGYAVDVIPSGTTNETFDNLTSYVLSADTQIENKFNDYYTMTATDNIFLKKSDNNFVTFTDNDYKNGNFGGYTNKIVKIQSGYDGENIIINTPNSRRYSPYYVTDVGKGILRESFPYAFAREWLYFDDSYIDDIINNNTLEGKYLFFIRDANISTRVYFKVESYSINSGDTIYFTFQGKTYFDEEFTKPYRNDRNNWNMSGEFYIKDGKITFTQGNFYSETLNRDGFFRTDIWTGAASIYTEYGIKQTCSVTPIVYPSTRSYFIMCIIKNNPLGDYSLYISKSDNISTYVQKRWDVFGYDTYLDVPVIDYSRLIPLDYTDAITTSVTSASTDSQVPSAKAVYDALQGGGGGGSITIDPSLDSGSTNPVANSAIAAAINAKQDTLVSGTNIKTINNQSILGEGNITIEGGSGGGGIDDNTQQLIATSLVDLNDRKADKSLLSAYATKSSLDSKANASEVMTLAKATENEKITASALNELNNRIKALEEAIQALQNN